MQRASDRRRSRNVCAMRAAPGARAAAAAGVIAMTLAGCMSGPTLQPQAAAARPGDCSALQGMASEMATITSATVVAAGDTIGTTKVTVPFCRVQGVARPSTDSLINFEVWLPATASSWSGRLKTDGTGGYAGATPIARMATDLAQGFVVAGSDMGHAGGESADWTMGHPEKVKDWGYRAHYFRDDRGEDSDERVLRQAGAPRVLRGLLQWRQAGHDDGAALPRSIRWHRGRGAFAILWGYPALAGMD